MQLDQIIIKGYKSISGDDPITIDLKKLNVILGANGSGKSNIISFFKLLNFMMSGSLQTFIESNGGSQSFLHYGSKITDSISATLKFSSKRFQDTYTFRLNYATPDRLIITSEEVFVNNHDQGDVKHHKLQTDFRESYLSGKLDDKSLSVIKKILANCKVYQFHDSSLTASMRNSCPVEINNYLQAEANNLAAFLYRIRDEFPDNYHNIVSYVRLVVPQFHDFLLEPNKYGNIILKWRDTSATDYFFSPSQFSDGSIRFIALATLLLQPKQTMPNMIIIDEPELGLHPYAINQLAEMIKEASKQAQIILATQSPYLIDEFEAQDVLVVESLRVNGRFRTDLKRLKYEDLKDWLMNYSLSELWDKNVIGGRPL